MGLWSFVRPEATTNLISNPSFETDAADWTAVGGSIARSTAKQSKGLYSLAVTPTGAGDGVYYALTLSAGTVYTFSVDVWGVAGVDYRIYFYDVTASSILGTAVAFEADGNWRRYMVTATTGANTSIRIYIEVVDASTADFYIDAAQIEQKSYATTYCDGDQDGCAWAAGKHTSTSSRSAQSSAGGRVIELDSTGYGFTVQESVGAGMPPVDIIDSLPAQGDGGDFQNQVMRPRDLQLVGYVTGSDRVGYHTNRLGLIRAFSPHRLSSKQPVQLHYGLFGRAMAIDGYYVGGLEKGALESHITEKLSLRFRAENPLFRAITGHNNGDRCGGQGALDAGVQESISNANYIIKRNPDGSWQAVASTGMNFAIKDMAQAPGGTIYMVGLFTTAGGVVVNYVTAYDPTSDSFSPLGGANQGCYDVAIGPDGMVYVGGDFTTIGGTAANRIAKYDPSTTTWSAMDTGFGVRPSDIFVGPDGTVYASVNTDVFEWTGSAWSQIGASFASGTTVLLVTSDNTLYVGGAMSGGVKKWSGSSWETLGGGTSGGTVYAMIEAPDGSIYIGGAMTTAGGITVNYVTRWNGSRFFDLAGGIDTNVTFDVRAFAFDENEILYVAGNFEVAGGLNVPDGLALWLFSAWAPVDVNLPATTTEVSALLLTPDGSLYIAFNVSGTATAADVSTATNDGSANSYPIITLEGAGRVAQIVSYTTNEQLFFDLDLLDGEKATLDLRPGKKTFVSTFRGNIIDTILESSDVENFHLMPGDNSISVLIDDATAKAMMIWDEFHLSIDGVVA